MIIGITGPSGAGKSTVTAILAEKYNLFVIDADKIAREVTSKGSPALAEIAQVFGPLYVTLAGELNRRELAKCVFGDKTQLEKLNSITHKYIVKKIEALVKEHSNSIIDAPLLFEAKLDRLCHKIILVSSDVKVRAERIMKRDLITFDEAMDRINSQKDYSSYAPKCDLTVNNDGENIMLQLQEVESWQKN